MRDKRNETIAPDLPSEIASGDALAKRIADALRAEYEAGNAAAALYSDNAERLLRQHLFAAQLELTCNEAGSAAELRRLKQFLGDSLPPDWESQRFAMIVEAKP